MTSFAFILGVMPLVVASGAGAEMRRSLGTAVFSGMLGVTLFGILLTPVFSYVIQGVGEMRWFAVSVGSVILSVSVGGLLGMAIGYLLAQLGVSFLSFLVIVGVPPDVSAMIIGGCAGSLVVLAVISVHRGLGRGLRGRWPGNGG
jgi:multidrug efflux pump